MLLKQKTRIELREGNKCRICGDTKRLEIHHKDRNIHNNSQENLDILCRKCHLIQHREAEDKILKTLKDFGRLSTSRIAGIIGIDYNYATKLLEQLNKEKKIKKEEETHSTYWSLK